MTFHEIVKGGDCVFLEKSPCLYRRRIEESRGLKEL
jgi:hypothetical protein